MVDMFFNIVGIPMGTNCDPLLYDLFLYSYKADFMQRLLKKNEKKLVWSFNFTLRYIDNGHFVDCIYPSELEA